MRTSRALLLCLPLIAAASGSAAAARAVPAAAVPPLIDRELLFGDPEVTGAQLSPDGAWLAFIKPYQGTRNVWVKRADEPFDGARPITAETQRPIRSFRWSRDAKYVLFVQDNAGDENWNVFAVDPTAAPAEGAATPPARDLTGVRGATARIYHASKRDPGVIYIGLNDRDPAWHDVYRVEIASGRKTLVRHNGERIATWTFDLQDRLRLATRIADSGATEILRIEESGLTPVYGCDVLETCAALRFHPDGRRVYLETNKGSDLVRLVLLDLGDGAVQDVESDPLGRVDLERPIFSEQSDELVGTVYVDDRSRVYWRERKFERDHAWLRRKLPGMELELDSPTRDERRFVVTATSDVEPGAVYVFDRQERKLTPQYHVRERLPREALAPMTPLRYGSADGLEIPGYLTLPVGLAPRGLPLVVVPHGGPWSRDTWGFHPIAQFLANRGYAVLQPNFRGSTGFGKRFLNAGNGEWGGKMQEDLTRGVAHLVERGVADPARVGILGGSYGGYAALAGVAFTPGTYAAAVSIVGPSNLITLLDSIPPYWEAMRAVFYARMGDPRTEQGRAELTRRSPLSAAERIRTPLLIVQGSNDPRVKRAESDQIVVALRDRGYPVEYLVAPDEGHGFVRPVNNMALFAHVEKFLAAQLGGRHQAEMPAEVARRLAEIRVAPDSVVLRRVVDPRRVGLPAPAEPFGPGTWEYDLTVRTPEQTRTQRVSLEIRREAGEVVAVERVPTAPSEGRDEAGYDPATLTLRRRSITQGPLSIALTVAADRVTGDVHFGAQHLPVDAAIDGGLFGDGPALYHALGALPLAEGYSTVLRAFDVRARRQEFRELAVTGSETVTVAAGTFEAFKVELTTAEDLEWTTVWIAKTGRQVVKVRSIVPELNGAELIRELRE